MKIEVKTLVAVASALLARIDARRAQHLDASDCAFEAVGMLRAFVEGYHEAEASPTTHGRCEACGTALTEEEVAASAPEEYTNCESCRTSRF